MVHKITASPIWCHEKLFKGSTLEQSLQSWPWRSQVVTRDLQKLSLFLVGGHANVNLTGHWNLAVGIIVILEIDTFSFYPVPVRIVALITYMRSCLEAMQVLLHNFGESRSWWTFQLFIEACGEKHFTAQEKCVLHLGSKMFRTMSTSGISC